MNFLKKTFFHNRKIQDYPERINSQKLQSFFVRDNLKCFTIEEVIQLKGNEETYRDYVETFKNYQSDIVETPKGPASKSNYKEEEREIITSLDVEKNKMLLRTVKIPGPEWRIGLVANLSGKYDRNGIQLTTKKKVKCLTILFITNWSMQKTQESFNTRAKVPCATIKPFCGLLPIVYCIEGFPTLDSAKKAFRCWKDRTRGLFSRQQCGYVIFEEFKKKHSTLREWSINLKPTEIIKKLSSYSSSSYIKKKKSRKRKRPKRDLVEGEGVEEESLENQSKRRKIQ